MFGHRFVAALGCVDVFKFVAVTTSCRRQLNSLDSALSYLTCYFPSD